MKTLIQFGFKRLNPSSLNWSPVLDCRVLPNPFKKGVPDDVLKYRVSKSEGFTEMVEQGVKHLQEHDTLYVGCLYGKHRSGAVAEEIARRTGASIVRCDE